MLPSCPGSTGAPRSSSTWTSYPGMTTLGDPALIGSGSRPRGLAAIGQPVSVCHQLSTTGMPRMSTGPVVGVRVEALAGQEQGLAGCAGRDRRAARRSGSSFLMARIAVGAVNSALTPVLGDHPPERARVRRADRLALVEHRGRADEQRRVDDVGVADDPADVAGGPEHVARADVVDVAHAPRQRHRVTAVVAHDALGLAGRAGGVEHVERVGGRDRRRSRPARPPRRARASRGRGASHGGDAPAAAGGSRTRPACASPARAPGRAWACTPRRGPARSRTRPTPRPSARRRRCGSRARAARTRRRPPSAPRRAARRRASPRRPRAPSACRRRRGRPPRRRGPPAHPRTAPPRRAAARR